MTTSKRTSGSVCSEAIWTERFVSGHDFSRAEKDGNTRALAPVARLPSLFGFGQPHKEVEGVAGMQSHYNVLFLCTGNSARSIMAEAIMNRKGGRNFTAYSAGSHPSGLVRPEAIRQLDAAHLPTKDLRSKSWDEFSRPGSPPLNFVFTVCDNAAKEICPLWPGQPMTAHWGIPDPAAVKGTPEEIERAFQDAFRSLDRRISLFISLPLQSLDTFALQREIDEIGRR